MFIIPIYLFSEIFPGVSRGPICSSCTRAHSPVWPPLPILQPVVYSQYYSANVLLHLLLKYVLENRKYAECSKEGNTQYSTVRDYVTCMR